MPMKKLVFIIGSILLIESACTTLPRECVNMSVRLENQIEVLEKSHLDLLELYYRDREEKILSLLTEYWLNAYIDSLFRHPEIKAVWDEVVSGNDPDERTAILKEMVLMVQEDFNDRKAKYLLPVTQERHKMRIILLEEYRKAKEMNAAITRNIASVNDIQAARDAYLSRIWDTEKVEGEFHHSIQRMDSILQKTQTILNEIKNKP